MTDSVSSAGDPAVIVRDFHRLWYDTGIRQEFEVDATRETLLMTFNPDGYLRRRS